MSRPQLWHSTVGIFCALQSLACPPLEARTINLVETLADIDWTHQLVAEGRAHWNGGKPNDARKPVTLTGRRTASSVVIEDRR